MIWEAWKKTASTEAQVVLELTLERLSDEPENLTDPHRQLGHKPYSSRASRNISAAATRAVSDTFKPPNMRDTSTSRSSSLSR